MVEREPKRYAGTAVMACYREPLVPEMAHHLQLVSGHGAFGVPAVIITADWLVAVAVAAQVRTDDGVSLGEIGCHAMPHHVGLGIAMQQKQRRAGAAAAHVDCDTVPDDLLGAETGEQP